MSCNCSDGVGSLRNSPYDMIPMQRAIDTVLGLAKPLLKTSVPLQEALGSVLAETVRSKEPLPPFRASVMDGYAVVASDGVGEFPILSRVAAGDAPGVHVTPGRVAYVTTGCPVPDGADAVVKIEDTEAVLGEDGKTEVAVKILHAVQSGTSIRPIGHDIAQGEVIVEAGEVITPAVLGLLATVGIASVPIYKIPVVGVLSTGSELVDATDAAGIRGGKIRDSNRPMLLAYMQQLHVKTVDLGICSDSWDSLRDLLFSKLPSIDVLITSGGVSMGEHDLVKPLLKELGTVHFGRIHMKPGKPTTVATVPIGGVDKLVFALPGNPVSCLVTSCLLVQPALKRLRGHTIAQSSPVVFQARLLHPLPLDRDRPEYHRAVVRWEKNEWVATSTGVQASSRLLSCRHANALLHLPVGTHLAAESVVECIFLSDMVYALSLGDSWSVEIALGQCCVRDRRAQSPIASSSCIGSCCANRPESARPSVRVDGGHFFPHCHELDKASKVSDSVSRGDSTDRSGPVMQTTLTGTAHVVLFFSSAFACAQHSTGFCRWSFFPVNSHAPNCVNHA
ncbi:hypothetical protein, variant 7 [Aphanomyces invadans]|uniref:MoaB/Mog domain-containing protein n=1 Tax=Aphanomyces invadans TaxID=157072 RepID=A0A024US97_9STRA|nr:hypothetical protein, variant 6 [Aphanomyces invadans]XP_008863016.1 hypothetical protein, variant 7 [Aphanomyces invadans]ETW09214.1 hypothetical protein, variant 6 [Aphanomyces invadans]ETW09215.1 hypothetical protein, variant 7 [Aphanomyces invadans]|eukprot:XP_008863015.1 hypothetical protein, variant 6 [Aphanomyces invadans]